ncbi:hypothetical protein DPMN_039911 [Dreissena polymorpha]|uniref:Uncharacterized protein n=1 Tax=Dreissena polymorpha TaxID=45954 RepID=A0A9D4CU34_DREPO|nr:hypothetical protein DPMN_039911 [Dreissena polymorpha]
MNFRVLTRFCFSHIKKNDQPLGGHAFQQTSINVTFRVLTRKMLQTPRGHFLKKQNHFRTHAGYPWHKFLKEFHKDRKINVGSRKCFYLSGTIFKHVQDIGKNLLIKFHEDQTTDVVSSVLTSQTLMQHAALRTNSDRKSSP